VNNESRSDQHCQLSGDAAEQRKIEIQFANRSSQEIDMAFSSQLHPNEVIINDSTPTSVTHDPQYGRGLIQAIGYAGTPAEPFPTELLIPESEFESRIKEKEERKNRISDFITRGKLPPHDQDGIPYCWIHGPTGAMEVIRLLQGQPMVLLSATSAGCVIKNFRSEGGWGKEGLQFIADRGLVPQSMWPENELKRKYDTPENWEAAKAHICTEWWELKPRNNRELASCVLRNIPVAVGYDWWGHEVYVADAVWLDGGLAWRIRNSWGQWGDNGFGILQGSKMLADDAVAPRVAVAS
jgi:hypothetical protein